MIAPRTLRERFRLYGPALFVLVLGVVATVATSVAVRRNAHAVDELRFREKWASVSESLRQRMELYVGSLRSTRAFFVASEKVQRDAFAAWVKSSAVIERYPGIRGIGLSLFIPRDALAEHLAAARKELGDGYRMWPVGERDVYSAIVYLEPLDEANQRAIGYDMLSEPTRRDAMERARDSGNPVLSGRVVLVQEGSGEQRPGFLVYVPLYRSGMPVTTVDERRAALLGWVYAPFRVGDLLRETFPAASDARHVGVEIYDGPVDARGLLGAIDPLSDAERAVARFHHDVPLRIGSDRTWTLRFATRPEFERDSGLRFVRWTLAGGAVITLLAAFVTLGQARRRHFVELTARRTGLLADAGRTLASSLEPESTLRHVTDRVVETLGDHCRIELPELHVESGHRAPTAHTIDVPLCVRGEELGRMTVARAVVPFSDGERAVLDELGRACAAAVDNARAYRTAREAVSMRDDFLSIASHEMKTPLTALRLQLQTTGRALRKGIEPATLAARLDGAERQVSRLARLVEELLDLSRIVHGKLAIERERLDLGAVVQEVASRHVEQAAAAGSTISVDAPALDAELDRLRTEQILTNLISNAIKYGKGNPIDVRLEQTGERGRIVVRDRGLGIAKDDVERIFGRFERAVSPRHYGGLGLGLFITRQIVEAHGGAIDVESHEGEGSTFIVTLPLRSSAQ